MQIEFRSITIVNLAQTFIADIVQIAIFELENVTIHDEPEENGNNFDLNLYRKIVLLCLFDAKS